MKVRQLIKELLDHDMEEMVIFILYDTKNDTFIWYHDVEVGILKDANQEYVTLLSKDMSKELYEDNTRDEVLKILDERIEYREKQVNYFKGHSKENYHDNKIILDELIKIKKWI